MLKSFLKWPGGKSRVFEKIEPYFSNSKSNVFVEPFAGSAVVSLNLADFYEKTIINDVNSDLIRTFRVLKESDISSFLSKIKEQFKQHSKSHYYNVRDKFNKKEASDVELAAMFVYLNRHCFNGLIRYNQKGEFNSPIGDYENPRVPRSKIYDFYQVIGRNNVEFYNKDFESVFSKILQGGEDVYCDPPYIPLKPGSDFTNYHTDGFGLKEHKKLKNVCQNFEGGVLISNSGSQVTYELYGENFDIEEISVNRYIGSDPDSRENVDEVLINKNLNKPQKPKEKFFEL